MESEGDTMNEKLQRMGREAWAEAFLLSQGWAKQITETGVRWWQSEEEHGQPIEALVQFMEKYNLRYPDEEEDQSIARRAAIAANAPCFSSAERGALYAVELMRSQAK